MKSPTEEAPKARRKFLFAAAAVMVLATVGALTTMRAQAPPTQSPAVPQWQTNAGGKMAFDVASVKLNKSGLPPSGDTPYANVAMGPGDYYSPTGGLFTATNLPVYNYIVFAYKATANQTLNLRAQVPKWVLSDRYDIQARVEGNPTKDQMRLMMQALLADRFKLAIHNETRQLPVFALVFYKPRKTGQQFQAHSANIPCSTDPQLPSAAGLAPAPTATVAGGFPLTCGGIQPMEAISPGRVRIGGRNVTMGLIASTLAAMPDGADRPVLDRTGLSGTFDFTLEWAPQPDGSPTSGATSQSDQTGPTFLEALKDQLGLKLDSSTGPVNVLVMDHVERPSEN